MIARPEWFGRRKYTGWGVTPKSWQGWAYIFAFLIPFAIFQALPWWSPMTRLIITGVFMLFLFADLTQVMARLKMDERERKIEAIAERNATWTMVFVVAFGIFFQLMININNNQAPYIDPLLIVVLAAGLVAKAGTNIYLEKFS
jgi:hypothetical protein